MSVHSRLTQLIESGLDREQRDLQFIASLPSELRPSGSNLICYLALRAQDHRDLQKELVSLGLSSLGRCEPAVLAALTAVRHAAGRLVEPPLSGCEPEPVNLSITDGRSMLDRRTDALLGPRPEGRTVRVMVTMPSEAADPASTFVEDCIARGTNAFRINTAHDDAAAWGRMIDQVRDASERADVHCRVFADLAGPKLRTTHVARRARSKGAVRLRIDDRLLLHRAADGLPTGAPAEVWITQPDALGGIRPGHRVGFDDGKLVATVESASDECAVLRITNAKPGGQKLRTGRGVNLPDTPNPLPAITEADREAIAILAGGVDAFCLSFINRPEDVTELLTLLRETDADPTAVVLKIETRAGFERLPELLLALMQAPAGGVMIARGDLAVEIGFARLAEVQEEILWLCEAAHTPVIWATEVLSSLAKTGQTTRGEVTDAAMAQRAECVMLNKGPAILEAVSSLTDILGRMEGHQRKKMATLRPLAVAGAIT